MSMLRVEQCQMNNKSIKQSTIIQEINYVTGNEKFKYVCNEEMCI